MPKLPKAFARRKSAANVLDEPLADVPPNQQSFRVFDRANTTNFEGGKPRLNGGSGNVSARPSTDPEKDDNMFSGFSNRRSAVSSASSDPNAQPDNNTANGKNSNAALPAVPKSTSKFSLISTSKAFSFGRKHSSGSTPTSITQEDLSKPPTPAKDDTTRSSTLTDSARSDYSSTNASLKLENRLSLGGDFAAMFMGGGNRKSAVLDAENSRTQSVSPAEGSTSTARQSGISRKPLVNVSNERSLTGDPWGAQKSAEKQRLMFGTSPGPSPTGTPPPVPEHESNGGSTTNRPGVGLRRSSAVRRQSLMAIGDGEDEDAKLMRESINAMRQLNADETPRARDSWINPSTVAAYNVASTPRHTAPSSSSNNTTPRARYPAIEPQEDGLFDQQTAASANLALQWGEKPSTPQSSAPKNKVMTTAQFERYRQDQERAKRYSNGKFPDAPDDDDAADDTYEDEDDDEEERRKEQAKQRRKQEAHMTVYRQQMMKITGETANPTGGRPGAVTSQSTPNLNIYSDNTAADEEEDEDIPLAILAAHGFPNRGRAPGQLNGMSSNPNLRASSQMGGAYPPPPRSVAGGAGERASAL
ncbi:hypothetical protein V493_01273, partial [Pseudogymnoascus sp. VKM F-4281 (FW-2241)]